MPAGTSYPATPRHVGGVTQPGRPFIGGQGSPAFTPPPWAGWISAQLVRTRSAARFRTMSRLFPIPLLSYYPPPIAVHMQAVNRGSAW